jgi:hypothetical protein
MHVCHKVLPLSHAPLCSHAVQQLSRHRLGVSEQTKVLTGTQAAATWQLLVYETAETKPQHADLTTPKHSSQVLSVTTYWG